MRENAFCMVFHVRWISHHSSSNPTLVATRLGRDSETRGEKNPSHMENHTECISSDISEHRKVGSEHQLINQADISEQRREYVGVVPTAAYQDCATIDIETNAQIKFIFDIPNHFPDWKGHLDFLNKAKSCACHNFVRNRTMNLILDADFDNSSEE